VISFAFLGPEAIEALFKSLSQQPVNVYSINYAVSGPSKRFEVISDLVNLLVEEFTVWLSARSNDAAIIPMVFFGYSYGGLVAYEVAAALGERMMNPSIVQKLILCAITSPQFLSLKNQCEQGILMS